MKSFAKTLVMIALFIIGIALNSHAQCEIGEIEATPTECDSSGYFNMVINFDHANTGSQGFIIQGNGTVYGTWNYDDLPVIINDLYGDGTVFFEFVVKDVEYPDCSNYLEFGTWDCFGGDCEIGELIIDDHPCDSNGMYYVYFNFDYANVSDSGFILYVNNSIYGVYFYEELPIENLGPFVGDGATEYNFLVRDADTWECASDANFGPIDCGTGGECNIWDVWADVQPCNEAGYFNVLLDFEYENVGNDGFRVQGNGVNYGSFSYDSIPVLIGPLLGNGNTVYEFVVIDNQHEYCSDWTAIDPVNCDSTAGDCNIWDLVVDDHPCDSGYFYVLIDFEYENVGDAGFELLVDYVPFGQYSYDDLPLQMVGPFEGDGTSVYHFLVSDLVYECAEDQNLGPVQCDTIGDCMIDNMDITILPCNDNSQFNILLDFEYDNTGPQFGVIGNKFQYGPFEYSDLPIELGPLAGDGVTEFEFLVFDIFYACAEDTSFGPVYCDSVTEFMNFSTQVISCNDEMYELQLNFETHNAGNQGFTLHGNDEWYGNYTYDQLPVTIGPLETDGITPYHFIARDKENPAYGNWDKLIPFTCASLGIEEPAIAEAVKVYPNPSNGSINFENLRGGTLELRLFNSTGAEAYSFTLTDIYQVQDLDAGMYFYMLSSDTKLLGTGKIIVTE